MTRHQGTCKSKDKVSENVPIPLPSTEKALVKTLCLNVCATELRPFSFVDGRATKALHQRLIKIGHTYGPLAVSDVSFFYVQKN